MKTFYKQKQQLDNLVILTRCLAMSVVNEEGAELRRRLQLKSDAETDNGAALATETTTPTEKGDAGCLGDDVSGKEGDDDDMDLLLRGDAKSDDDDDDPRRPSDRKNIAVLLFLYVLQGVCAIPNDVLDCSYMGWIGKAFALLKHYIISLKLQCEVAFDCVWSTIDCVCVRVCARERVCWFVS